MQLWRSTVEARKSLKTRGTVRDRTKQSQIRTWSVDLPIANKSSCGSVIPPPALRALGTFGGGRDLRGARPAAPDGFGAEAQGLRARAMPLRGISVARTTPLIRGRRCAITSGALFANATPRARLETGDLRFLKSEATKLLKTKDSVRNRTKQTREPTKLLKILYLTYGMDTYNKPEGLHRQAGAVEHISAGCGPGYGRGASVSAGERPQAPTTCRAMLGWPRLLRSLRTLSTRLMTPSEKVIVVS